MISDDLVKDGKIKSIDLDTLPRKERKQNLEQDKVKRNCDRTTWKLYIFGIRHPLRRRK